MTTDFRRSTDLNSGERLPFHVWRRSDSPQTGLAYEHVGGATPTVLMLQPELALLRFARSTLTLRQFLMMPKPHCPRIMLKYKTSRYNC